MVTYNTQYRKHYKDPRWDRIAVGEYNRKLDYRIGRRSVEHQHQPWSWESDEEGDEGRGSSSDEGLQRSSTKVEDSGKTSKDIKHGKEVSSDRRSTSRNAEESDRTAAAQNSQVKIRKRRRRRRASSASKLKGEDAKEEAEGREASTSNGKTAPQRDKEPFVSYGWANKAPIDKRFTYNVKASAKEVYPAALRALKRRELEVRRKLEENQKKSARELEQMKEMFFIPIPAYQTFLTEYQRSYCVHDNKKTGYVW